MTCFSYYLYSIHTLMFIFLCFHKTKEYRPPVSVPFFLLFLMISLSHNPRFSTILSSSEFFPLKNVVKWRLDRLLISKLFIGNEKYGLLFWLQLPFSTLCFPCFYCSCQFGTRSLHSRLRILAKRYLVSENSRTI